MNSAPPSGPWRAGPLFTRKWPLVTVCVAVAVAEALVLEATGATWAARLAPQVVAPAPFGLFHDLRWLVVYHYSWASFAAETVALLIFRSLLDAVIVRLAWPEGYPVPTLAAAWRRTAAFSALAVVLLAPWVTLLFGMAIVSLSWLFFAAVPPVLAVATLTHPGAVSSDWWRRTVPLRAVGWVALTFGVMTVAALVVSLDPVALAVPVAAAGGVFNAWAWRGVVRAVATRERSYRFRPVAPAGLFTLLLVAVGGAALGFAVTTARAHHQRVRAVTQALPPPARGQPVLIASGFGTKWDGVGGPWLPGPFDERRFSYRGLDAAGRPLPYSASDTVQSLPQLEASMAGQVDALYHRTGRRVSVVAVSEGSLVAETFLAHHPRAPVDQVLLLSPLVRPGRVYYPPQGTPGWGMVGGFGLQALTDTLGGISPFKVSTSTPLFRSIMAEAPLVRSVLSCPPPGVRQVAVQPLADAVAAPSTPVAGIPTVVVPAFHSGALGDPAIDGAVVGLLEHHPVPGPGGWALFERVLAPASTAWQVPELALSVNPVWELPADGVGADGGLACTAVQRMLAAGGSGQAPPVPEPLPAAPVR